MSRGADARPRGSHAAGERRPGPRKSRRRSASRPGAAESATTRPPWWLGFLIVLFVVALGWRALALARLAGGPLLTELTADADVYWRWAGQLRAGQWLPVQPFFLAPLYPYWLAVMRSLLGDSIASVLGAQAVLGAAAVVLLADATRRIASTRAGVLVGVALAGYGMAVAFDLLVLGESLLLFLGSLALWLVVRGRSSRPLWIGALIGLMGAGRPTFLLLLVPYGAYLVGQSGARRLRALGAALVVPVAVLVLTAFLQSRVGGSWTPITYSGGFNFYVGNGPLANGTYVPVATAYGPPVEREPDGAGGTQGDGRDYLAQALGLHLSPAASSRYWFAATLDHLRAHPARVLELLARKLGFLFNHRELSQLIDTAAYDHAVGPLGWPLDWGFAPFGVLGLLGFVVAWRRGPVARLACGWLVALALGTAAFFVVDRYRIHLIPPLAILSGIGVENAMATWRARRWREVWVTAGLGVIAASIVFAPLIPADPVHVRWSSALTMADAWLAQGEARRALTLYAQAIAIDRAREMPGSRTLTGRLARAGMYENAATAYALVGDERQALDCLASAVRWAPEAASTRVRYADRLARSGRFDEARSQYDLAGLPLREAADLLVQQAAQAEQQGNRDEARTLLTAAAGILPGFEPALVPLVRLEIVTGSLDSASRRLAAAAANGLDVNLVRAHLAWIRAALGDSAGARRILATIPSAIRSGDPKVAATLELMRRRTR